MAEPKTIYLEADEEVTSVIDKLRKTEFKDVILVVPKEASLMQSVVNLKLIKKQAENLGKTVSLVTQDKVGRNLADKVGLATAARVGQEPKLSEEKEEPKDEKKGDQGPIEETNEVVFKKSGNEPEIGQDDLVVSEDEDTEAEANWHKKELEEKQPTNLMPKFPKKKLFLIGLPILIILLVAGFIFLPRAKATVLVQAERRSVNINFSGEKEAKLDTEKAVVPAKVIEATKEVNKKFQASGKKNVGTQANGTLAISNLSGQPINWVVGTRFVPTNNTSLIYRATGAVSVPNGQIVNISVQAANPGDQYNGFGNNQAFTLAAGGLGQNITIVSAAGMSGGTNKEVTYVTQGDVNTARENLAKEAANEATSEFNKEAENLKIIDETKKQETISADANPGVNGEASEFTMTVKVSVKALAYNMDDLSELIKTEVERQMGSSKQVIDNGADSADISIDSHDLVNGKFSGSINTSAYVANKLDENQIKTELTGTGASKADEYLKSLEGVEETKLDFWPSFIKIFPRLKSHIYLTIEVADNSG